MEIIKKEHKGYTEWHTAKLKGIEFDRYFGRWQYIFRNNHSEISVINIRTFRDNFIWEVADVSNAPNIVILGRFEDKISSINHAKKQMRFYNKILRRIKYGRN